MDTSISAMHICNESVKSHPCSFPLPPLQHAHTHTHTHTHTTGFITMTPQLFINYKLKSVAHLPWRMLTYKVLNTFIDDMFAFVIKMPTMYRIGCFRDGKLIIRQSHIYVAWIYGSLLEHLTQPWPCPVFLLTLVLCSSKAGLCHCCSLFLLLLFFLICAVKHASLLPTAIYWYTYTCNYL